MAKQESPECPKCGSTAHYVAEVTNEAVVCADCMTLYVPETREDPDRQMCNDCAFRPDSPERKDHYKWAEIIQTTIVEEAHPFHCHKGMECVLSGQTIIYDPKDRPMRVCAGWRSRMEAYRKGTPTRML